jgi:formylmethanofuran dehydrogenase subunit C
MSTLTLTQRQPTDQRLDMGVFTPERLAGMSTPDISRIPVFVGNRKEAAGELFQVTGEPGERVTIIPSARNLDNLGSGMSRGELRVEGDAGRCAGRALRGGDLTVEGSTGDEAGTGMSGGRLYIHGDTGERLGGPVIGATQGMSGGLIGVGGKAGDRAGERLRRGMVLIRGDAGTFCGANMIAGTVAVGGKAGDMAGSGMRRGTLLLTQAPESLPVTFNDNGEHELSFLGLLLRGLSQLGDLDAWSGTHPPRARRFLGDLGEGGIGEILWPAGVAVA